MYIPQFNNTGTSLLVKTFMLTSLLAVNVHAEAKSVCKGLTYEACDKTSICTWVDGYERKNGRKVGAFCRTSPKASKKARKKARLIKEEAQQQ